MFRRRRRGIFDIFDEIEEMLREMEELWSRGFRELEEERGREVRGPYIYGIRIFIGPDGVPRIERFGNITRGRRGEPEIKEEMEPVVDVIEKGDEIIVVADVPGVSKEEIDVEATERRLIIRARSSERKYYREVELPADVDPTSAKASYRNGILEVRLKKKGTTGGHKISVE